MRKTPSVFNLMALIDYDASTGEMTWKRRVPSMFMNQKQSAEHQCRKWNSKYARQRADYLAPNGYRYVHLPEGQFLAHRIAWKYCFNTEPDMIDHINGNRSDNRIANLRSTDKSGNARNMKRSRLNTSGANGVSWRPQRNKWRAYICVDRKHKTLGHFDKFEDAVAARKEAEAHYGYHENHGRD